MLDALNLPDADTKGNYTFFRDRNSLHASQKSLPLLMLIRRFFTY